MKHGTLRELPLLMGERALESLARGIEDKNGN